MQIVLICQHESGSVAFHPEWINGHHAPERRYDIRNHQVVLDGGFSEAILHHDAEELLKNPLYRMPTPAEQEAMAKEAKQASMVQEYDLASFTTQVQRVNGDGETIFADAAISVASTKVDPPALPEKAKPGRKPKKAE